MPLSRDPACETLRRRRLGFRRRWPADAALVIITALMMLGLTHAAPPPPPLRAVVVPTEVRFMRDLIGRVNPSLLIEDAVCAEELPRAIFRQATRRGVDWRRVFAIAWQESGFDCHAKNLRDPGGAFGPFQIRRVWGPIVGDPRRRYFEPAAAAARVVGVLAYYLETDRYRKLVRRRFRFPLLCLYNTGEALPVNMRYCREISQKMAEVMRRWHRYQGTWAPGRA